MKQAGGGRTLGRVKEREVASLVERRVIRRGPLTTVLLVLVLTISAGATMAAVAGGRRASTSYDRFIAWSDGAQVIVGGNGPDTSDEADANLTLLASLPQVEHSTRSMFLGDDVAIDGEVLPFHAIMPVAFDPDDPATGRFKVLAGRRPDPDVVSDAVIGFDTAERLDLHVGDQLEVRFNQWDDRPEFVAGVEPVTIVGIIAQPGAFPSVTGQPTAMLGVMPAFLRAHEDRIDWTNGNLALKLRDPSQAGIDDYREAVAASGVPVDFVPSILDDAVGVRKLLRVEAGVLWLMAVVIGGAAVVVVMQFFRREAAAAAADFQVLGFLGMTRSTIVAGGAVHGVRVGAMGAVGATIAAIALSPLLPRGVARKADPDLGFHADLVVLGVGIAVVLIVAVASGAVAALLASRSTSNNEVRTSKAASIATHLPPAPAAGVRLAFVSTTSGPARSLRIGLLGLGAILATVVAVVSLQASFDEVLDEPALSGSTWDLTAAFDETEDANAAAALIAAEPAVDDYTRGGWWAIEVNGKRVYAAFLEPSTDVQVAVDRGRAPIGPDEIALGPVELEALGVSIGDTVEVAVPEFYGATYTDTVMATVTGRAIVAAPIYESLRPGEGGAVTAGLMRRIIGDDMPVNGFLIAFDDGASLQETSVAVTDRISPNFWFTRADRAGVRSLRNVRQLPVVLVALLGVMAAAALVHRLVTSSRSMRRDLAVLRSMGFTDSQFVQSGGSQGAAVSALALVGAVPAGLICATVVWRLIAEYLVVVPRPIIPTGVVVAIIAATLVLGAAVGILLALRASRIRASALLRVE